jgi:hypothetical protein
VVASDLLCQRYQEYLGPEAVVVTAATVEG